MWNKSLHTKEKRCRKVNFYLGKWFWSLQCRFARNAYLLIAVYSIFGFSRVDSEAQPQNCFDIYKT